MLQGKGLFPSSVWDPWWNRAAQGAGLLKIDQKSKVEDTFMLTEAEAKTRSRGMKARKRAEAEGRS